MSLPVKSRVYQTESLDSTHWDHITHRDDDIIIATAMKVGTTWMERILSLLVHKDPNRIDGKVMNAPWPDAKVFESYQDLIARTEAITTRRFFKTHIPLDGLTYNNKVKYIHVSRDTRDVFMSLINHWSLISDFLVKKKRSHPPLFETMGDIHELWELYTSKSIFEWEHDGWPYWSNYAYTESFWDYRQLPNILFVHYSDMKSDLQGQIRRVAKFLDIDDIDDVLFDQITEACTFSSMKKDGDKLIPKFQKLFKGGAKSFIFKGESGRWKEFFTEKDQELYEKMNDRYDSEMVQWVQDGSLKYQDPQLQK